MKFKDEYYKGVRIMFFEGVYDGWRQKPRPDGGYYPAVKNPKLIFASTEGYGVVSAFTKKRALKLMKESIDRTEKSIRKMPKEPPAMEQTMMREMSGRLW
jgi:hypothetical protein